MTIQLNPTTADAYETKSIADLRQRVFNGLGFLDLLSATRTETLGAIRNDIFNMLGMAAMTANPPPGVVPMLNSYINEAQQTLFRTVELGTGTLPVPPVLVNDTDLTVVDGTAVRQLALGMAKAHYSQEDGQIYLAQNAKYLKDLVTRSPPSAKNLITQMIKDAQMMLYRRYAVFRMERWFTWTFIAGQRFYPIAGNDERAPLPTPTGVAGTQGDTSNYGSMEQTRVQFASVVLNTGQIPSGQVLNVGGFDGGNNIFDSAELFDPVSGLYSTVTSRMTVGRLSPMAVTLNTGQVLVCGGLNGDSLQSAELYNPQTQTFVAVPDMFGPRRECQPVRLQNGKVLFAGGVGAQNALLGTAELFDPTLGIFTAAGDLNVPRQDCAAVALKNGAAVVVGGFGGSELNSAEVYDPATNTFTNATLSFSTIGNQPVGVLLANGKAFFCGGTVSAATTANTSTFDPATNTLAGSTAMPSARKNHTATLLGNGKVLIAGGFDGSDYLNTSVVYDPAAGTYTATANTMPEARSQHNAVLLIDGTGRVLLSGGENATGTLSTACFYDPATNRFTASGAATSGIYSYRVAFIDVNGKTTLASTEVNTSTIPARTAVVVSWTPPTNINAKYADVFGRTTGAEKRIARVDVSLGQYIDTLTITPSGALPTANTTGNIGPLLDQRQVSWVGISQSDVGWRPLLKGVPPTTYSNQTNSIPNFYDIREQIEVWPPPVSNAWALHIKGYFTCGPFDADTDITSIDWQAVYLQALSDAKLAFKQPDANLAQGHLRAYIGDLIAGTHGTARYLPGPQPRQPMTRPLLLDSDGNPVT